MFRRRLNAARKDALDIPKLPKGHYWVLRANNVAYDHQIYIRRHKCLLLWENVMVTSSYGVKPPGSQASREAYQRSINDLYASFKQRYDQKQVKIETWESWSGDKNIEKEVAAVISSRANLEKTAIRYG